MAIVWGYTRRGYAAGGTTAASGVLGASGPCMSAVTPCSTEKKTAPPNAISSERIAPPRNRPRSPLLRTRFKVAEPNESGDEPPPLSTICVRTTSMGVVTTPVTPPDMNPKPAVSCAERSELDLQQRPSTHDSVRAAVSRKAQCARLSECGRVKGPAA